MAMVVGAPPTLALRLAANALARTELGRLKGLLTITAANG
jgi:hypothetical protein